MEMCIRDRGNVNVLNRLAEKNTLPPFYDGKVSQDRPYRREVADVYKRQVCSFGKKVNNYEVKRSTGKN